MQLEYAIPEKHDVGEQELPLPAGVREFCERHGLLTHLQTAAHLAKECLQPLSSDVRVEQDPESGEQWLVLTVVSRPDRLEQRR